MYKYQVSLDQLLQIQSDTVIFSGNKLDPVSFGFNKYLEKITNDLKLFKNLENPQIYYFSKDFPLFHYMQFPELCAFKFFFWKRTYLSYPQLARQQFNGGENDKETIELAKNIIELYTQIPSTEIWNEESVHITISQIEFYRQSNIFANTDILLKVYMQLEELLNHVELQAAAGKKFLHNRTGTGNGAPYDIYINEILIGSNSIYVKGGDRQITFLNHNGLDYIATEDKNFCDYTFKNLQNIMSKSTHISVVGEKERSIFFNTLRKKIYDHKKNIN